MEGTLVYKKKCPYCKGVSYSAASYGRWVCPYCGADLTIFIPEVANNIGFGNSAGSIGYSGAGTNKNKINIQARNKLVPLDGGKSKLPKTRPM